MAGLFSLVQAIIDVLAAHPLITSFVLLVTFVATSKDRHPISYPSNLPLLWEKAGTKQFSLRTRLAFHTDCARLLCDAYELYSRRDRTVRLPGLGFRDEIILPSSSLRWLLTQPDHILGVDDSFLDHDPAEYSLGHLPYVRDKWLGGIIRRELSTVLDLFVVELRDELFASLDDHLGHNTDSWTEIDLSKTLRAVIAQSSSRYIVGSSLCRDQGYLEDVLSFNDGCLLAAGLSGAAPKRLRSLVGPVVAWPLRRSIERVKQRLAPLFAEKTKLLNSRPDTAALDESHDLLEMMMRFVQGEHPEECDLDSIAKHLCLANLSAMQQTTFTAINLLLDIVGSDQEYNTISVLRDEFNRVLGSGDRSLAWTKNNFANMVKCDSAIRESMRLHSFSSRALLRVVMIDGVRTEDGIELPKGSLVSVLSYPVHHSGDLFEDPVKFDPLRYTRRRHDSEDGRNAGNLNLVTTGPHFLPFGHGKRACPGRFLVDFELKMLVAHLVDKYDMRLPDDCGGLRPANRWITEACLPPKNARLMVKRRSI